MRFRLYTAWGLTYKCRVRGCAVAGLVLGACRCLVCGFEDLGFTWRFMGSYK